MYDLEVGAIMRGGPWDKRHESIRRVYRIDGISPTLTAGGGGGKIGRASCRERV